MAAYTTRLRPDYTAGRVDVPDVGGIFLDFADRQMKQHQIGLDNAMQQAKMEEDRRRYETELGFKQRQEGRVVDELNRAQATREAIQATLNPEMYRNSKLTEVDNAIQQGLANLSPQDRAEAEAQVKANWDRTGSGNYALGLARDSTLADPSKVLSAQKSRLDIALSDPNSPEFKALQKAELDNHAKKLAASSAAEYNSFVKKQDYANTIANKEADKYSNYIKDMFALSNQKVIPGEGPKTIDDGIVNQDAITAYDNVVIAESNRFNELMDKYRKQAPETEKITEYAPGTSWTRKVDKKLTDEDKNMWAYDKAYKESLGKINYDAAPEAVRGKVEIPATPDRFVPKTPQEQMLDRIALMQKHNLPVADIKAEMKKLIPDTLSQKEKLELQKIIAQTNKYDAEAEKARKADSGTKSKYSTPKDLGENLSKLLGTSDGPDILRRQETIARNKNIPLGELYDIMENARHVTSEGGFLSAYNVNEEAYENLVSSMLKQRYPNKF